MQDLLQSIFGWVCGQDPAHSWAPGGLTLPCCQRCLGLYVGACVAGLLHFAGRPRLSGRFLETHGLMLLMMVPLGFHWVAQGPAVRAVSGVLFGAGVVTFLWLPLSARLPVRVAGRTSRYTAWLAITALAVPLLGEFGGWWAGVSLSALALAGMAALALLVGADVLLGLAWLRHSAPALLARKRPT